MRLTPGEPMPPVFYSRTVIATLLVIAAALLSYTAWRSWSLTLTPDEEYSFRIFSSRFVVYPSSYNLMSANHHWLNSWLMWLVSFISTSEFALRIPQIIAHALFLFFTAKLFLGLRNTFFTVGAFLILNCHPYILDFFSLARGYGLSFAMMAGALYFLWAWIADQSQVRTFVWLILFSMLSVLANFTLLSFYLPMMLVLVLQITMSSISRQQRIKYAFIVISSVAGLLLLILPHLLAINKINGFYFGAEEFWEGTVKSVVINLLYDVPYAGNNHFSSAKPVLYMMALIIIIATVLLIRAKGPRKYILSFEGSLFFVFCGVLVMLFAQHYFMQTLFPQYRTGLFLFILFVLLFIVSLNRIPLNAKALSLATCIIAIPVIFHFAWCANTVYVREWKACGNVDVILKEIEKDRLRTNKDHVTLSSDGTSAMTALYYRKETGMNWLDVNICWGVDPMPHADYYLVEQIMVHVRNMEQMRVIYHDPLTGNTLYADE